jgi:CBS domain-containing protein
MSRFNTCSPETQVHTAARMMKNTGCSALLVITKDGKTAGTLTEKDLSRHVVADGLAPQTPVEQVMNRRIETIPVDYRLSQILEKLPNGDIERLVIIDEAKRPVGLLRYTDLFGLLAQEFIQLADCGTRLSGERADERAA